MSQRTPFVLGVDSRDPDEAQQQLTPYYCHHELSLDDRTTRFRARQLQGHTGGVAAYCLSFGPGRTSVRPAPFGEFVLISRVLAGQFRVSAGSQERVLRTGDSVVLDPYTLYRMRWENNCSILTVRFDRDTVERARVDLSGGRARRALKCPVATEPSAAAARALNRVTGFLVRDLLPDDLLSMPLLRDQFVGLFTAAVLGAYPSARGAPQRSVAAGAGPGVIRCATEYIEQHAASAIRLDDIAAAAGASPRTVQEAFRTHLDTTPMRYLKSVRLRAARTDLQDAASDRTVADVAYRWGFQNLGRFAASYREAFGHLPSAEIGPR